MDTRKLGLIFLVISGSMVVIAFMTFIVGGFNLEEIDVEEKSIYKGVDGDINVNKYDVYSVFVTSEYSCKDVELSIYKDDWEYFFEDCDALFNEDGWNYITIIIIIIIITIIFISCRQYIIIIIIEFATT